MKDSHNNDKLVVPKMDTVKKSHSAEKPEWAEAHAPQITRRRRRGALGGVFVLLCMLGGFLGARLAVRDQPVAPAISTQQKSETDGNAIVTQSEQNIAGVVDKVSQSVVSIVTTQSSSDGQAMSAGTGVILSADGYIMTNHHVVGDATQAEVVSSDGTRYGNVAIVGSDPLNDLAFLKIKDAKDLKPASIGTSSTLRVGQQLVAIGNALGQYQNTVSSGILSGIGRPVTATDGANTEQLTDLLQTDAAINSGNSGGPLLNLAGQVVGINTAVVEDAQGIGFAIPIDAAKGEIKSVLAGKGVQRTYMGVNYVDITSEIARENNLPAKQGAYVYSQRGSAVVKNSPAAKAGIKNKDIIVAVDGRKVGNDGGLSTLIGRYVPGETVQVTVLRDGKEKTVSVKLDAYKQQTKDTSSSRDNRTSDRDQGSRSRESPRQDFFDRLFGE